MTTNGTHVTDDGVVEVSGSLTFDTVPDILEGATDWLGSNHASIRVDLKAVSRADSAGLALLLEWLRLARSAKRELEFVNIPEQVRDLIHVSGLMQAFQLSEQN